MKYYYYANNDQQFGPFTIEELKSKRLKKSVLVWTDGMKEWASADSVGELKDILISEPPPLPKSTEPITVETTQIKPAPIPISNSKYDLTYTKEDEATFLGAILLIVPIALMLSGVIKFETQESYNQAKVFFCIGEIVLRIAVTAWVAKIASRQNRNSTSWGCLAFFLPSIALILIGQLKKISLNIEIDSNLPVNQQTSILLRKANQLYSDNRFLESIEVLNKAIEIDSNNYDCIKLRGLTNYKLMHFDKAKNDFETLNQKEQFPAIVNYYLGNIELLNYNREKAIEFWLKAKNSNSENAQTQLDLFHTFCGEYLLDSSQTRKKLGINSNAEYLYFHDGKYLGGLNQIDQIEKINSLKSQLRGYDNGLEIELRKTFKTYHIAIAFYEMDDIIFNEPEKTFEVRLYDNNILSFSYDQSKDYSYGLKILCNKFKKATGKTASAASSEREKNAS
jgi:hypothetical protein